MFAPPGFVPIKSMWSATRKHLGRLHVKAFVHTVLRFENHERKADQAWSLMTNTGLMDSFENRLFLPSFRDHLYLACPTGQMVVFDIASAMDSVLGETIATDGGKYPALELTHLPKWFRLYLLSDRPADRIERIYRRTLLKFEDILISYGSGSWSKVST